MYLELHSNRALRPTFRHAGNLKERQLDHSVRLWQRLGELMCLGLFSGRITVQFSKEEWEISPCSAYDFAGTEATNSRM